MGYWDKLGLDYEICKGFSTKLNTAIERADKNAAMLQSAKNLAHGAADAVQDAISAMQLVSSRMQIFDSISANYVTKVKTFDDQFAETLKKEDVTKGLSDNHCYQQSARNLEELQYRIAVLLGYNPNSPDNLVISKTWQEFLSEHSKEEIDAAKVKVLQVIKDKKRYPGLMQLLDDLNGSMFLADGVREQALQYLTDKVAERGGKIDLMTLDYTRDPTDLHIRLAVIKLLCLDGVSGEVSFLDYLEAVQTRTGVDNGANVRILDNKMLALIDQASAERAAAVNAGGFSRWQEENKRTGALIAEISTTFAYACLRPKAGKQSNAINKKEMLKRTDYSGKTEVNYGDQFTLRNGKKALKPNVRFTDGNGYTTTTDKFGHIATGEGKLKMGDGVRNRSAQKAVGGADRLPTDDGGHLFARQHGGSGDIDNLTAQSQYVNRAGGEWYKLEQVWTKAIKNNQSVHMKTTVNTPPNSERPESYTVHYWIDDVHYFKHVLNE